MVTTASATKTGLTCTQIYGSQIQALPAGTSVRITHAWRNETVEVFGTVKKVQRLTNQVAFELDVAEVYEQGCYPFNPDGKPTIDIRQSRWSERLGWAKEVRSGATALRFGMRRTTMVYRADWQQTYATGSVQERLNNLKNKRQESGYTSQRHAIALARDEMQKAFALVGLNQHSSFEEFKAKKRELLKVWHPDKQPQSALTFQQFQDRSIEVTSALAKVQQYLDARDNRSMPQSDL